MKIKGALISQMSGKLGGVVAATVKGGMQVLRRRPVGSKVASALQATMRAAISSLAGAWSGTLTAGQRSDWNSYGAAVTKTNGFGDQIHVSGNNWFVGNNSVRIQANAELGLNLAIASNAPIELNLGDGYYGGYWGVTVNSATGHGTLTMNSTYMPCGSAVGDTLLLFASKPYSPGRASPVGGNQLVASLPANGTLALASFTLTGGMIPGGSLTQQSYTLRQSRADGRLSSPFRQAASVV
jgi:hypothetical protein